MRTIKFRIWDNLTNEMYYDALVGNYRGESTVPCVYLNEVGWTHTDNCVVEQFTGLYDKNGTEIYEGDIINCNYDDIEVWDTPSLRITITSCVEYIGSSFMIEKVYYLDYLNSDALEVIGNIHDNKEIK